MSALLDSFSILFFVAYHIQCIVQLYIQLYTLHAFKTLTTLNTPTTPQRFADVDRVLVSYFTFRALKETLTQIQETDVSPNKTEYKWLYEFASANNGGVGRSCHGVTLHRCELSADIQTEQFTKSFGIFIADQARQIVDVCTAHFGDLGEH